MRNVSLIVRGTPLRYAYTWAYPEGEALGLFITPVYQIEIHGKRADGKPVSKFYEALRFGVHCTDGKTAQVVGLAKYQQHRIKSWIPTYTVHSAVSTENGAWQVYKNFLIHDGPDDLKTEVYATIGCIEIVGTQGFTRFNDHIIELSGPKAATRDEQLVEIGNARNIVITYHEAARPPLRRAGAKVK